MCAQKLQILPLRRASPPSGQSGTDSPATEVSIDSAKPTTKKPRASKPKVRTGCLTCKIRRVKCDETKPGCNRCSSTGRKCDGYYIPPRRKNLHSNPAIEILGDPERCLDVVPGTPNEIRALEFFHDRTAPGLSSYFDADFWTRLVLQISHTEPAIKHAMVAVGSLHQQRELGIVPVPMLRSIVVRDPLALTVPVTKHATNHNDPFALTQYNKAIVHLSQRLKDPAVGTEIALLACILFVCVEFLRGDVEPAIRHFKSGMSIATASLSKKGATRALATTQSIKANMLPFFNRLELLSTLFGNDADWDYPVEPQDAVPRKFTSLKDARDSLVHLMNISLRFIRYMKYRKYEGLALPDDISRKETLQRHVIIWQSTFDALLINSALSAKDRDAAKVLRIHQLVVLIWLGACIHGDESSIDAHMADFETAVSLGEAIQTHAGTQEQRQTYPTTFLFDMEIVSPLYYVAGKCRHPQLRRRAIALLRQTVRREGLWDSNMAAAIAERLMTIEEAHLTVFDGSELPEEKYRIHNSHIQSMAGINPDTHAVTFYTKPNGPNGAWKIWQETIILESNVTRAPNKAWQIGTACTLPKGYLGRLSSGIGSIDPTKYPELDSEQAEADGIEYM